MDIVYPKLKVHGSQHFRRNFLKATAYSLSISIIATIPFLVFGQWVIPLLFGAEFQNAIPLLPYLALVPAFSGLGLGTGPVFRTLKKVHYAIIINSSIMLASIYPGYLLIKSQGTLGAALFIAIIINLRRFSGFTLATLLIKKVK